MSLNFVTRKLKTQKLEEDQQEEEEQQKLAKATATEGDARHHPDAGGSGQDSDSGTESDPDDDLLDAVAGKTEVPAAAHGYSVIPPYTCTPNEDNYSSEEELKEIINEKQGSSSLKKKSPSKKEKLAKKSSAANVNANAKVNANNAEKRKWSEVISDDDLADLDEDDAGLELEMTTQTQSSRLYVRSSGGNTTASSSCSNDDESCMCGRRLTTPVQFCTSPPMDVHRPRRKPWTPPPPKVFHVMASNHSTSFDLTQEEDDEIVDIENRASSRPRQAAFVPVHTASGGGNASSLSGVTSTTSMPSCDEAASSPAASSTSQYCPRHHHHTQQQPQRQTPSPNKRHRLTPRPHNIQRPCLDFEKMQQIKKRVVTSWRPQGAELSLFCW